MTETHLNQEPGPYAENPAGELQNRLALNTQSFQLEIFDTPLKEILAELGFDSTDSQTLIDTLESWNPGIKYDWFKHKLESIPLFQRHQVASELSFDPPSLSEKVSALGQALFWAHMYKDFDAVLPDRMTTIKASSKEEYDAVEGHLADFLKNVLFAPTSPLLRILKDEYDQKTRPIQTEFLRGLIKPFIDTYDEPLHENLFARICRFLLNLDTENRGGFGDLRLTYDEAQVLKFLATRHQPKTPNQVHDTSSPDTAEDSQRINILISSHKNRPVKDLLLALEKELSGELKLDETTVMEILLHTSIRAGAVSKSKTLRTKVSEAMQNRGIGSWTATNEDVFQHTIALTALMSLGSASAGFIDRLSPLMEAAFSTAEDERSSYFDRNYRADLRRLSAALLMEKQRDLIS